MVSLPRPDRLGLTAWPARGQASYQVGAGRIDDSPDQQPVAIASVAKVMTAYLVLARYPMADGASGPSLTVTAADVADTEQRAQLGESVVPVEAGEALTERQALEALLLPSANNVAIMLARWAAGSVSAFVAEMNDTARRLGMTHTTYTDPSGFDPGTVSTAGDQVLLADVAMKDPAFAALVGLRRVSLPVAGKVDNTDPLLGTGGFVGIKTGSTTAAGGCLVFRAYRRVHGRTIAITGAVLGQEDGALIASAAATATALVHRVTHRLRR